MKKTLLILAAAAALAACGEKPQTTSGAKQDAAPHTGTGKAFVESGWKQGDKTSWESQLKARGQNSQNEYTKTN
jgi:ABC-type glycerol-3-phosphate transport system substrate-binding protein